MRGLFLVSKKYSHKIAIDKHNNIFIYELPQVEEVKK